MAANRRYRRRQKAQGKAIRDAHKATLIDLTMDIALSDDDEPAQQQPKVKVESPPSEETQSATKPPTSEKTQPQSPTTPTTTPPSQKTKAHAFMKKMDTLRKTKADRRKSANKKTCKKARGPPDASPKSSPKSPRAKRKHAGPSNTSDGASSSKRPKNVVQDASADPQPKPTTKGFKYPLDTFVARDFGADGIFQGKISKHYSDDDRICQVTYTDGDTEDMDAEQVEYGIKLYEIQQKIISRDE